MNARTMTAVLLAGLLLVPSWGAAQSSIAGSSEVQDNMQRMQQQMDKIRITKDPKARQKLLEEHMQTMQQTMRLMRGMGGPAMANQRERGRVATGGQLTQKPSPGEQGGMAMPGPQGGMADDSRDRQEMMERRMDMMQMMMEQMMQRDQAMSAPMGHM